MGDHLAACRVPARSRRAPGRATLPDPNSTPLAMTLNMGRTDRTLRLGAAAVLLLLVLFVTEGALDWALGGIALVLAATSFVGTCPAYLPFGFSTRKAA